MTAFFHDGDDDDDKKKKSQSDTRGPTAGDYNLGDDIGERIGEGKDPVESEQQLR